jgi:protocatechuate 3,4-dioxygenase beta subunit
MMAGPPDVGPSAEQVERLRAAVPVVADSLRRLARDVDLTNEELLAALQFIADVVRADELILLCDVLGLSRIVDDQTHADIGGTASNVLGPFYRPGAPWVENPGSITSATTPGEPLTLVGVVADAAGGRPLAGAELDVWQANGDGVYSNEDARLAPWDLRGRQRTDRNGRFEIATVRPKHYTVKDGGPVGRLLGAVGRHPWRPAHIHVLARATGHQPLVTQVYVAGGPYLDDDTIDGVKDELIRPVMDGRLVFDITLPADPPDRPSRGTE